VAEVAESVREQADPEVRLVDGQTVDMPYGKVIRQGDVYLRRLPLEQADVSQLTQRKPSDRQIAPGATVGSRHLVTNADATIYDRQGTELEGPIILAPNGLYLAHPKHADFDIRLPGAYECTFPVDEAARELGEIRRRRD